MTQQAGFNPSSLSTPAWFVDSLTGSDSKTGTTVPLSLRTCREIWARFGSAPSITSTDVAITLANDLDPADAIYLVGLQQEFFGSTFRILGKRINNGITTLLSLGTQGINHANPDAAQKIGAPAAAYVKGQRLVIVGGSRDGATAIVQENLGNFIFRTTPFMLYSPATNRSFPPHSAIVAAQPGDTVQPYRLLSCANPFYCVDGNQGLIISQVAFGDDPTFTGQFIASDCNDLVTFNECDFVDGFFQGGAVSCTFNGCFTQGLLMNGPGVFNIIGSLASFAPGFLSVVGGLNLAYDTIVDAPCIYSTTGLAFTPTIGDCGFYNIAGDAITAEDGSFLECKPFVGDSGVLYGTGTTGHLFVCTRKGQIGYTNVGNITATHGGTIANVSGVNQAALPVPVDAAQNGIFVLA